MSRFGGKRDRNAIRTRTGSTRNRAHLIHPPPSPHIPLTLHGIFLFLHFISRFREIDCHSNAKRHTPYLSALPPFPFPIVENEQEEEEEDEAERKET